MPSYFHDKLSVGLRVARPPVGAVPEKLYPDPVDISIRSARSSHPVAQVGEQFPLLGAEPTSQHEEDK